jgi:predicted TIM-barrel fold metal-dependent hydrolase
MEKCVDGLCFSSTTTCMEDIAYSKVENEISQTLARITWTPEIVRPFFWYIPAFAGQGINIESAMNSLPYKGIKLHPLAHNWNIEEEKVSGLLCGIFEYAGHYGLPVLIHTGNSGVDAANMFSKFFPMFPETKFFLAHCRPLAEAVLLLKKYINVYGDTAFLGKPDFHKIVQMNLIKKIVLGSDFPITNYFSNKHWFTKKPLKKQYDNDFKRLQYFSRFFS